MQIDRILASNGMLGVVLVVLLLAAGRANRGLVRDVARDPDRLGWLRAKLAVAAGGVFIAWTSLFDNWRQLNGLPYRLTGQFPSERIEYNPPSAEVRTITLVLLAISLVFAACLLARHVGGYGVQVVIFLGAVICWLPLFIVRQRLNVNLGLGFEGDASAPLDVLGYLLWVVMAWLIEILLILASYLTLLAVVALPVTLLLDLTRLRQPRVTKEAAPFFASLHERARGAGGPR
jgi:hypothetical protein